MSVSSVGDTALKMVGVHGRGSSNNGAGGILGAQSQGSGLEGQANGTGLGKPAPPPPSPAAAGHAEPPGQQVGHPEHGTGGTGPAAEAGRAGNTTTGQGADQGGTVTGNGTGEQGGATSGLDGWGGGGLGGLSGSGFGSGGFFYPISPWSNGPDFWLASPFPHPASPNFRPNGPFRTDGPFLPVHNNVHAPHVQGPYPLPRQGHTPQDLPRQGMPQQPLPQQGTHSNPLPPTGLNPNALLSRAGHGVPAGQALPNPALAAALPRGQGQPSQSGALAPGAGSTPLRAPGQAQPVAPGMANPRAEAAAAALQARAGLAGPGPAPGQAWQVISF